MVKGSWLKGFIKNAPVPEEIKINGSGLPFSHGTRDDELSWIPVPIWMFLPSRLISVVTSFGTGTGRTIPSSASH